MDYTVRFQVMVPLLVIGVQDNLMGHRMHVFLCLLQPPRGCKLQRSIFIWTEIVSQDLSYTENRQLLMEVVEASKVVVKMEAV